MKKVMWFFFFWIISLIVFPSFGQHFINPFNTNGLMFKIWLETRIPRTLMGLLAGGNLAVSGYILQNILLNPLATPYTLGISTGASVGVLISMVFIPGLFFGEIFAFSGALLGVLLAIFISKKSGEITVINLILAGIVINVLFSSLILLFYFFAPPNLSIQILHWLIGSLDTIGLVKPILFIIFSIFLLLVALLYNRELDILILGESQAKSLGVDYGKMFIIFILIATILTAAVVSEAGPISFVGLIIPHILRIMKINKASVAIPLNFLAGGIFLAFTDTIARLIVPEANLPVGIVTAFFGGIFFLYILKKA